MSRRLEEKKMYWGRSTWQLFHSMGEKINPYFYTSNRYLILDMIKQICKNLPCPDCAKHATSFMNNVHPDYTRQKMKINRSYRSTQCNMPNYISLLTAKQLISNELNITHKTEINSAFIKYLCNLDQPSFIYDVICLHFISLEPLLGIKNH